MHANVRFLAAPSRRSNPQRGGGPAGHGPMNHRDGSAQDEVYATAAELFRLLATPMRLKIISALGSQEKNVSQLLAEIDTTQPNMSQHLAALYRAGVLARRRDATQIYYRIASQRAATLCRAVCSQIAAELQGERPFAEHERLAPRGALRG